MIRKLFKFLLIDDELKNDITFLKRVALFQGLSDKDLSKIALIIFKKNYIAGEKIFEQKQEANVVYIIRDGQVKLSNESGEKTLSSDDFFGEISLIDNRRHDYSATALKNSHLYLIYRVKLDDMVDSDAKVGLRIMKNLSTIFAARLSSSEL